MAQQITRNSTPTFHLDIPTPVGGICDLYILFKQSNKTVIERKFEDVDINRRRRKISFTLTTEETRKFTPNKNAHMQLIAKYSNGTQIPFGEATIYVLDAESDIEL